METEKKLLFVENGTFIIIIIMDTSFGLLLKQRQWQRWLQYVCFQLKSGNSVLSGTQTHSIFRSTVHFPPKANRNRRALLFLLLLLFAFLR